MRSTDWRWVGYSPYLLVSRDQGAVTAIASSWPVS
jgi:hypothetical protein